MKRSGNQLGFIGLALLTLATGLQFINKVPAIVAGVTLQWASIVLFLVAGVRRPRTWFWVPVGLVCLIAFLIWWEN